MLNKIVEISDHKCFRSFKWAGLPDMGRLNLFYGWNGSGKTTLSSLLALLENNVALYPGKITFQIDKVQISGDKLHDEGQPLPRVKVFNQKFIEGNVLSRVSRLEHIVFFGEKTLKHEEEKNNYEAEMKELHEAWKILSQKKNRTAADLENFKKEQALTIKEVLRTAGKDKFTNYDKGYFEARCDAFDPGKDLSLTDAHKNVLTATIRADIRETISVKKLEVSATPDLIDRVSKLLNETPSSVAIEELRNDGQLADWVARGLHIHNERRAERCLFCESSLSQDRVARLAKHFDESFSKLQSRYTQLLTEVEAHKFQLEGMNPVEPSLVYPQLVDRMREQSRIFEDRKKEVAEAFSAVLTAFLEKGQNLFVKVSSPALLYSLVSSYEALIETGNAQQAIVAEHNQITANFKQEVNLAKSRLEGSMISAAIEGYRQRKERLRNTALELSTNEARTKEVRAELDRLATELTETIAPADALNKDLFLYLGHSELKLTHHGNGYMITRGNEEARDLSEGEKTAFALLYFLKTLEDHRGKLDETIVVIDDPVSSLDAAAMFTAFGFIKERTERAKQIVILTHDFSFFHLVKGWLRAEARKYKDQQGYCRFYSLVSKFDNNGKFNTITELDRLLRDYASEYHYLFSLVKKGAEAQQDDLSILYGLPNVGRKLLEHFLAFRYPSGNGKEKLIDRLKHLGTDAKTLALLNRFLNMHSHGDEIASTEHDLNLLSETPKVMKAILDAMKTEDAEHVARLEVAIQQ